jgi:transposase
MCYNIFEVIEVVRKNIVTRGGQEKTYIRVIEGYRPGPGQAVKQRTIKSFGYLEDQSDPEAFMEMVEEFNRTYRLENAPLRIEACSTAQMYSGENRRYNYGYKYLEAVYDMLSIDEFVESYLKSQKFRGSYPASKIFKYLVLHRLLKPDSNRASFQQKELFYGMETDFTLDDVYRSLDKFADFEVDLQRWLNEKVKEKIGRDLKYAFYDVTNYFFEIDHPDGEDDFRRKGVSKEHRVDPITAMSLFMDGNGLPVSMSIFPGNTSESLTLKPTMEDVKKSYGLGRLIVVADKGINSLDNINTTVNAGDGFVFSQILKGKKGQHYHEKLFSSDDWVSNKDEETNTAETYRYKLFEEDYEGKDENGKKVVRKRKVLIYWNKTQADRNRRKREEKLAKAAKSVKNNAYSIKKGVDEYTKENIVNKETGEFLENTKKFRSIDIEKAEKDALYDGYNCIITSEMDYDEQQIRKAYGGLWRIEQSFRITCLPAGMVKSDLYVRPVFVRTNEHTRLSGRQVRAHFLICFVALLVIRVIQHLMGENPLSAERIARALNAATCHVFKGGIVMLDDVGGAIAFKKRLDKTGKLVDTLAYTKDDEIALDYKRIQNLFGTSCYNTYQRQENFNKFFKNIEI